MKEKEAFVSLADVKKPVQKGNEILQNEASFSSFSQYLSEHGDNYLRQAERVENKAFDSSFIEELEKGLEAVEKIISNPRTFLKEQSELVKAELAKKISALSVTHLASHSRYVRSIDDNGDVIPKQILTINAETDSQIYENRFVMTLIRRCLSFINTRYFYILEHGETFNSDILLVHNKVVINGVTYEVDTRVRASVPSDDAGQSESNRLLLERLVALKERWTYCLNSPFMSEMKGAKEVSSPIHMTNMIVKNPDYHAAYVLWEFISNYDSLGISYEINETDSNFTKEQLRDIYSLQTQAILTLESGKMKDSKVPLVTDTHLVEPKVIFSLEDETYSDAKYLYDAYPAAKEAKKNPMAYTPEEWAKEKAAFLEKFEIQKVAKEVIDKAILSDKDQVAYQEALERDEKAKIAAKNLMELGKKKETKKETEGDSQHEETLEEVRERIIKKARKKK
ncbi:MAG: DUF2357 domain-containing protein [Bacilli bacterium]|nr:DUF2357 domain-containing protein [Bacilli bacterium]